MQTQATLIYGARESKPHSVVCFHSCLSEVEDEDQALCTLQTEAAKDGNSKKHSVSMVKPQTMTSKLFVPKTADMNSGFLTFSKEAEATVLKEEPDDLTYLAPIAGDSCIPLDLPSINFASDLFDPSDLTPELLDCIPLTALEFPILLPNNYQQLEIDNPMSATSTNSAESERIDSPQQNDPFLYLNFRTAPQSLSSTDISSLESNENNNYSSSDLSATEVESMPRSVEQPLTDDEEELGKRAPFIPMSDDEDLSTFDPSQLFSNIDLDYMPISPAKQSASSSTLVELLQATQSSKQAINYAPDYQHPLIPYHAFKRGSIDPPDPDDVENPKRMRNSPSVFAPARCPKPSRGASLGLVELLTEKIDGPTIPNSVLQNLLVSGYDSQMGYQLQPKKACSPHRFYPLASLFSSSCLSALEKNATAMSTPDQQTKPIVANHQVMNETASQQLNSFELADTVSMDTNDFFNVLDAVE